MIELPRAALMAGEIAETAEFFSFGTNDLTQTTIGISRDDAGRFLTPYVDKGIFLTDPFVSLAIEGVGQLIEIAADRGRSTRPDVKLGICGEHRSEERAAGKEWDSTCRHRGPTEHSKQKKHRHKKIPLYMCN